ncbi:MAG TPA: type II toxin-antitoxin system RelE/ParE family toxin [Turneriella sp.]|nr:type II toxin-antitoxin system RelE/ParE family toxin [Turneriella sp.]
MALKVEVSASCEIDLEQAYQWYESHRAQLGLEFLNDFDERLNLIAVNPYIGAEVYRQTRKFVMTRFPYIIYYLLTDDHVKVVACLHGGLDPRLSAGTVHNRIIEQ